MKKKSWCDSTLIRFGTILTSVIELNILWLICSLPVVTAGTATVAVYYTMYQILENGDDAVFQPFFRGFRQNFKQSTLLWLPILVAGSILIFDWAYLIANFQQFASLLWLVYAVILFAYLVILTHAFAIMGRYKSTTGQLLKNCFLLFMMNFLRSISVIFMSIAPVLVLFFLPEMVIKTLPLWVFFVFGAMFLINSKLFLQSFEHSAAQ